MGRGADLEIGVRGGGANHGARAEAAALLGARLWHAPPLQRLLSVILQQSRLVVGREQQRLLNDTSLRHTESSSSFSAANATSRDARFALSRDSLSAPIQFFSRRPKSRG